MTSFRDPTGRGPSAAKLALRGTIYLTVVATVAVVLLAQASGAFHRFVRAVPNCSSAVPTSLPVALVVGLLLLAGLSCCIAFGLLLKDKSDLDTARTEALSTARNYAVTLTSYDHTKPEESVSPVLDGATGEFKTQYEGANAALRELITKAKATAQGTVVDAGVKSVSEDRVEVVRFVDQAVSNAGKQPQTNQNRMLLTLERHGDRWLVNNVALL